MIIHGLIMLNWECYRGAHNLKLGPGVWAIVARYEDDPEHSNAAGKTGLMAAIYFALYGAHRKRYEDDWITRDESEGFVEIRLGTKKAPVVVRRSRTRGKSTQLEVTEGDRVLKGDEAQEYIDRLVGLSKDDFVASSYLQQKEHSRFVTGDPSVRNAMVADWLEMDKLIASEKYARDKAKMHEEEARKHHALANGYFSSAKSMLPADVQDVWKALRDLQATTQTHVAALVDEKTLLQSQLVTWKEARARFDAAQTARHQYDVVVEQGKALKLRMAAVDIEALRVEYETAHRQCDEAFAAKVEATKEYNAAEKLATQGFSGCCPVTKMACPVPDHVKGCVASMASEREKATVAYRDANAQHQAAAAQDQALATKIRAYEVDKQRLESLRDQVRQMKLEEVPDPGPCPDVTMAIRGLESSIALGNQMLGRIAEVGAYEEPYFRKEEEAREDEARAKKWRAASQILKAAQRRVGEVVLARIEHRANELLLEAGIRLEVDISWAREGKDYAADCDVCGTMYPSKGGKTCGKCGAERPKKVIQRLEVELSDRSGALDDLAGIAIQLAASEWLRTARGSQWGVLMLDEPFGSLDRTNRLAMSGHILKMVDTFEQAFIISHTPDTAMAMPNRIEVVATINGSKVEVAS